MEGNRLLNKITGYDTCESLRESVTKADAEFQSLREALTTSREAFTRAIQERSACQKELNSLLQRKPTWIDTDLQRFTELYRHEMRLESTEKQAKEANEHLEKAVDKAHNFLISSMRERYQEEQLWSDKIRRLSSFGTFGLMAVNLALFLVLQTVIEPRKRQRFISDFEKIVIDKLDSQPTLSTVAPVVAPSIIPTSSLAGLTPSTSFVYGSAAVLLLNCFLLLNFR